MSYVYHRLAKQGLPFHYVSVLALCASHNRDEALRVKTLIVKLVQHRR